MNTVAEREAGELADAHARRRTALLSVGAAIFLVAVKLITGLRPTATTSSDTARPSTSPHSGRARS